jgi:hypothetical protein|tara:strand:+ start:745 stop:996 length:252 start_codon:yes stop_codon:yes gene_type:complete
MEKVIKCLLLKNNQVIVSEVVEVEATLGDANCKLINPCLLNGDDLVDWLTFTDQNEIMVRSDDMLTVVDPTSEILEKYESLKY